QKTIKETIRREEEAFNKTLDKGILLFDEAASLLESISHAEGEFSAVTQTGGIRRKVGVVKRSASDKADKRLAGEFAFRLYDEQGFPLDLTELMARERGLTVDVAHFEKLMEEQRERARKAQKKEAITVEAENLQVAPTKFLGYDFVETESVIETMLPGQKPDEFNIVLDQTPCYREMGGQVGDQGRLHVPGHDRTEVGQLRVTDTQKRGDVFIHRAALEEGRPP